MYYRPSKVVTYHEFHWAVREVLFCFNPIALVQSFFIQNDMKDHLNEMHQYYYWLPLSSLSSALSAPRQ